MSAAPPSTPEVVRDLPLKLGEAAVWHDDEAAVYFTDIEGAALFRYHPDTDTLDTVLSGRTVADLAIQEDGSLLLFGEAGRISRFVDGEVTPFLPDLEDDRETRFNDVYVDPEGRIYCGTMPAGERTGRLYRLDHDGTITTVIPDAGVSNGMGVPAGGDVIYHTNTSLRQISRYPWDRATGALGEGTVIVAIPPGEAGGPDGMALDANGDIWSARYGGGAIVHYAPDGQEIGRVSFPALSITSIAFAGPDLRTAYVTSAGGPDRPATGELAGSLFRFTPGVAGRLPFRSRIRPRV